ncbi:MAG TPA: beta-N-acetylhexosaminidase, partial [Anaerolineales bacterium]|nr:beta-N-acetylhexosaminidase [Anaerolineales bacterium]
MNQNSTLKNLIPKPVRAVSRPGIFQLSTETSIHANHPELAGISDYLRNQLAIHIQMLFPMLEKKKAGQIRIDLEELDLGVEGYRLHVNSQGVRVSARDGEGVFRGVQTLLQLIEQGEDGWFVPACEIEDEPRFSWRGVMLDVARHFFP